MARRRRQSSTKPVRDKASELATVASSLDVRVAALENVCEEMKQMLDVQFKRIAARRGIKRALIAVAHAMLIVVYTMLRTGVAYHELGGEYLERIHKDQLQKYYIRRLQRLGLTVSVQPAA